MDCQEFLSSYTDYRDGLLSDRDVARAEVHLSGCESCRRYRRVVDEGIRELRSLPSVSAGNDFRPRLQHRIYHLEDGDAFGDGSRGSGTTAVAAVGIAVLLTAAAWSPVLRQAGDTVTLPAIVVSQPEGSTVRADVQLPSSAFFREEDPWRGRSSPRWSPPTGFWTASAASRSSPGIRATVSLSRIGATSVVGGPGPNQLPRAEAVTTTVSSVGSVGKTTLSSPTPAQASLLRSTELSLPRTGGRPVLLNASSASLASGSGRVGFGVD